MVILLHSLVDFNMHIPANAILAVALMALLTGHLRFATERYWVKLGWVGKPLLTLVCLTCAAYLATQGARRAKEHVGLERAQQARELGQKVEALRAAHAAEPRNSETTYQLGETLRLASWQGLAGYRELATAAMQWFELGIKLNRFDPYNYLGYGMCLHWLDRHGEAAPYFQKAIELDPRSYYMQDRVGWHYFQLEDYAQAKIWFEKAKFQAHWHPDPKLKNDVTAQIYLRLIEEKLASTKR
jgi:tetratricopeptide (TPR) repeat protein